MPKRRPLYHAMKLPYSTIDRLRKKGLSNDEFELFVSNITLEDLIALKLELSANGILGGKLYGFPLYKSMIGITRNAVLKFACAISQTKKQAAAFLGVRVVELLRSVERHDMEKYFLGYEEDRLDSSLEDD